MQTDRRKKDFILLRDFTEFDVILSIKKDIAAGLKNKDIAEKYGKSASYISSIKTKKRWANVLIDKIEEATAFDDTVTPEALVANTDVEANVLTNLV